VWARALQIFLQVVGYPLAKELVERLIKLLERLYQEHKEEKEIKDAVKQLKESKSNEEIIKALRNLNL
jgi:UDP-N-acetylglucosamine:LPS N-acetylglucosamine transferase